MRKWKFLASDGAVTAHGRGRNGGPGFIDSAAIPFERRIRGPKAKVGGAEPAVASP